MMSPAPRRTESGPRRRWDGALLWGYTLLLLVGTLYPFRFAIPPTLRSAEPRAPVWDAQDGLVFSGTGMFSFPDTSPAIVEAITTAGAFYVYLEARPETRNQYGPRRLFTLSRSKVSHAFLVGQEGNAVVVRVRHARPSGRDRGILEAIFPDTLRVGAWQGLLVTADRDTLRLYGEGRQLGAYPLQAWSPAQWSPENFLVAGNEATGDRGWRGRLRRIELGAGPPPARILEEAGIPAAVVPRIAEPPAPAPLFDLAADEDRLPQRWTGHETDMWNRPPPVPYALVPFQNTPYVSHPLQDLGTNLLLFAPLGWLWVRRGHRVWTAVVVGGLVSVLIEAAQIFLPARTCDATDVVLNTVGVLLAATGAHMARALSARRHAAHDA